MATQFSAYGYQYPQPSDPVREGAANIGALANQIKAPERFPGQGPLVGSFIDGNNWKLRHIVYNYAPPSDQYGLMSVPLPFTECCFSVAVMVRNFRQPVNTVVIALEYCTVQSLGLFARAVDGSGVPLTNVDLNINAWGI
jgi:hypothetical protein